MKLSAYAALALALSAPVAAQNDPASEPAAHPDWDQVARAGVQILRNSMVDPESLQIEWVSGFKWGYRKPVIGRRTYGWIACGNYNARNQFGGYTGAHGFTLVHTLEGETRIYEYGDGYATCERGLTPVNKELLAASGADEPGGLADELAKLADLHSKGALSDAEFNAAKAKLLSP